MYRIRDYTSYGQEWCNFWALEQKEWFGWKTLQKWKYDSDNATAKSLAEDAALKLEAQDLIVIRC